MTLAIPYWWSKSCYDITYDEMRGGWKCLWFRVRKTPLMHRGSCFMGSMKRIDITIEFGRGSLFIKGRY
jgi:hypothetical protein